MKREIAQGTWKNVARITKANVQTNTNSIRQNRYIMYVEKDRAHKKRKSCIEQTDGENLTNTIKQMANRLDKEQTAWAD